MKVLVLTVLWVLPFSAYAEVADKIQSYPAMWLVGLLLAVVMGILTYLRPLFLLLALLVSLFLGYGYYDMASDSAFRQLLLSEMGDSYFLSGYASSSIVLIAAAFGAFYRYRNKHGT